MSKTIVHVELTQEVVKELLDYDLLTGALTWRPRSRKWFHEPKSHALWNRAYAGKPAFTYQGPDGYLRGGICNRPFLAHRVAWLWVTGQWPERELDHINRNPADNRWANLREADHHLNMHNKALQKNNTTGFVGVSQTRSGTFSAYINDHSRIIHLGTYPTKYEAAAARCAASKQLGYSPGHGRARLISNQERMRT